MPLAGIAAVPASATVTVTNTGPLATSFTLGAERMSPPDWSISFVPATTPVLAPGRSAVVVLQATGAVDADGASLLVTARRDLDGATRAFAELDLVPAMPTPDLNGDGIVDGADLGVLLAAWGAGPSAADLNEDGVVDGADLGILLAAWD
jgi:hypothetical protein